MFPVVEKYESGELTRKEICMMHELKEATFGYWVRRYREDQSNIARSTFMSLDIIERSAVLELSIGDAVLRFEEYPPVDFLRSLLDIG